jgi:hypothetical protein
MGQQFVAGVKGYEVAKWGKLVKQMNIRMDRTRHGIRARNREAHHRAAP